MGQRVRPQKSRREKAVKSIVEAKKYSKDANHYNAVCVCVVCDCVSV